MTNITSLFYVKIQKNLFTGILETKILAQVR